MRYYVGSCSALYPFAYHALIAGPDGTARAEGRGAEGLVEAEIDLDELRTLRRAVPVRRDERRDVYGAYGPAELPPA